MATRRFDVAAYLEGPEDVAEYLVAAFETGDPSFIASAIGDVARARGMTEIAREAGVNRESLYRALSSDGHPEFETVVRVLGALGVELAPKPKSREPVAA
jgi:probable addiction module antidote protein